LCESPRCSAPATSRSSIEMNTGGTEVFIGTVEATELNTNKGVITGGVPTLNVAGVTTASMLGLVSDWPSSSKDCCFTFCCCKTNKNASSI